MVTRNAANMPTGASGTIAQGQGVGSAVAFSTATYPATTTAQQILYSTATNVVGQLTTANSALAATNSSGTLAMRAFSVVQQIFTSSGTYTPTSGMLYCFIQCLGGGGAGGGAAGTNASGCVGSGGSAGEYAEGVFSAATIGASQSVTIGAAGTANSGATGGNGGNTSVGSTLISANGGAGGITSATGLGNLVVLGGAGGTGGTGGSFRTKGANGYSGKNLTAGAVICEMPGAGANSQFGSGGQDIIHLEVGSSNSAGNAAAGYGAGGSGGYNYAVANVAGGAGTAGIVVITEYVIA